LGEEGGARSIGMHNWLCLKLSLGPSTDVKNADKATEHNNGIYIPGNVKGHYIEAERGRKEAGSAKVRDIGSA